MNFVTKGSFSLYSNVNGLLAVSLSPHIPSLTLELYENGIWTSFVSFITDTVLNGEEKVFFLKPVLETIENI